MLGIVVVGYRRRLVVKRCARTVSYSEAVTWLVYDATISVLACLQDIHKLIDCLWTHHHRGVRCANVYDVTADPLLCAKPGYPSCRSLSGISRKSGRIICDAVVSVEYCNLAKSAVFKDAICIHHNLVWLTN